MPQNIYDNPAFFAGYQGLRAASDTLNALLEQPMLRALTPDLADKRVLDMGCGAGGFAMHAVRQGARHVTAVDVSERMLEQARQENGHERIVYHRSALEELEMPAGSVDVGVSSLALHYVEDYGALVRNVASWLAPGGVFAFSVEHPMVASRHGTQEWPVDADGQKVPWPVDNYAEEGRREYHWFVDGVVKYHRTVATYVNTLIASGFIIERLEESAPTLEAVQQHPRLAKERRAPAFLLVRARAA